MSQGTKRGALAALGIAALAAALYFALGRDPASTSLSERDEPLAREGEPDERPSPAVAAAPRASGVVSTPAAPGEREPEGPRPAPGAAPWASGLDLPPPAPPETEPVVDPAHMRYREQAEDVAPADQVAYLEQSLQMLDASIEILESDLEESRGTARAASLGTRLARLRLARAERGEELEVMRARAAAAPAPSDELQGGAAIRARESTAPAPSEGI